MGLLDELAEELAALEELSSSPEPTPRKPHRPLCSAFSTPADSPPASPEGRGEARGARLVPAGYAGRAAAPEPRGASEAALALQLAAAHERALCAEREEHRRALDALGASAAAARRAEVCELRTELRAEQQAAIVAMARRLEQDFQAQVLRHRDAERAALNDARAKAAELARVRAALDGLTADLGNARAEAAASARDEARARGGAVGGGGACTAAPPDHAVEASARELEARLLVQSAEHAACWAHTARSVDELARALAACAAALDARDVRDAAVASAAQRAAAAAAADAEVASEATGALRAELRAASAAGASAAASALRGEARAAAAEAALAAERDAHARALDALRAEHAAQLAAVERRVRVVCAQQEARIAQLEAELRALVVGSAELLSS
ncbi:hypothetical protein KFE25_004403 [Diacronema lutheri]|uniref:Uncharacterized protein n=1 Tax=Diacronema lutheri TaxID=2081491 RepID=A0A8J5X365_DIALT|nr:hypothetical protein KFE25_004403 [Diacronema lutheri]